MTGRLWDLLIPLAVAAIIAGVGWLIRCTRLARQRERARDVKLDRLVQVFLEGTPADPFSGTASVPSVVAQLGEIGSLRTAITRLDFSVGELRESNVAAGVASRQLADDVTDLRAKVADLRSQLDEVRALVAAPHPPFPA